ncbi:MAG TPA: hypothetical protein G4O00_08290 [Thermoflexia bacterium]|jgi:hypothetical protein|nr:hypothetical protein [Thermoflexia bacterium]
MAAQSFGQTGDLHVWLARSRNKVERPVEQEGRVRKLRRSLRQLLWGRRQRREREEVSGRKP